MYRIFLGVYILSVFCWSCENKNKTNTSKADMAFELLDASVSGIDFTNVIIENDTLNYFTFPYLYLGGGVSVGDINNDGLTDIYFTGNLVSNKLYLNKGNLVFEDISEKAGVSGDSRWYTGTTMADVNNDGFLDIYVGVSEVFGNSSNQLFINNGDNTFTEQAENYGIADKSTSIQSTFFDYDNDGFLDLFVANYPLVPVSQGNWFYYDLIQSNPMHYSGHLYRNNGNNTFTDVTLTSGVQNFGLTLGLVASDFNNDGYKDLYLSNDFNVPDYFYQNNGDGTFSEVVKNITEQTSMFGMGADAADFNNDGLTDIIQVDMTAEDYKRSKTNMASMSPSTFYEAIDLGFGYQYMQNSLQLNNGINDGHPNFSNVARFASLANTDWSWGPLFADFDNDGLKDVFITNGVKRDVNNNDVNKVYDDRNPFDKEVKPNYKLLPSTPIANYAYRNNGDLSFSKVTDEWGLDEKGFSNGFAYADFDNDGDLDLVINNLDAKASIYINNNQQKSNHYLKIQLKGENHNPFALGAKVSIKTSGSRQFQELTLTRGYQSSVEPILHFGLGKEDMVEELQILWPKNGQRQILNNIKADQLVTVQFDENISDPLVKKPNEEHRFEDITINSKIDFIHKEDKYDDFKFEPLLPHQNSKMGPGLAVGDVNNDGLQDFFIGNAKGFKAALFVQNNEATFQKITGPWELDASYEDTGAIFFDADNDGDSDLYVVSGGNNKLISKENYKDRLYLNTEKGFVKATYSLPNNYASGQVVLPQDFDNDGDLDLFVGGRISVGHYPYPAKSSILRNDGGKDTELRFTDVTKEIAPNIEQAGLITSALWDDFNLDGNTDLIISGEWMPIRFFKNNGASFTEVTDNYGLKEKTGWWYGLEKADLDDDGDMDYVAGNLGLNYKYKASAKNPFEVYANDFDENGSSDIVLSYKKKNRNLPLRGRECSSEQVPAIKKRFKTFESFANADLNDIYGEYMLKNSLHYKATTFAHYWLERMDNGSFEMHRLPNETQLSSINALEVFDYNNDRFPDIMMGGNLFNSEVETPRNDAGIGTILLGGSKEISIVKPEDSGLFLKGEIKEIKSIKLGNSAGIGFLVAANNCPLKLLILKKK
ncbi:VCBS repeat-containing protein [Maribacter sp. 2210JD10-5]|uniref:VCBS repeat-containing protein n=1 Tax=Maribacter sp. 2210JD10-5 TaxID=3386272 RepID=UPI0039BC944D